MSLIKLSNQNVERDFLDKASDSSCVNIFHFLSFSIVDCRRYFYGRCCSLGKMIFFRAVLVECLPHLFLFFVLEDL